MSRYIRQVGLALMLTLLAGATGNAQWAASNAQGGGRARGNPPLQPGEDDTEAAATASTGELVNMLDTYAIVQAQKELALDDAQYGGFVARLRKLQDTRRRSQRERNRILQDLRKLSLPRLQASPDEATLKERLRELREHDSRTASEMATAYDALGQGLTPIQQARFRVLEEQIERRKLDLLVRARERAGRGGRR